MMSNAKSYSLEELANHHDATLSNVSRYVSERDYNELLLKLETAEQNAAEQRDMKAKAREQRDEQVKKNAELAAQVEHLLEKLVEHHKQNGDFYPYVSANDCLAEHDREVAARAVADEYSDLLHVVANQYDGDDNTDWSIGANHVFVLFRKEIQRRCGKLRQQAKAGL